MFSVYRQFNEGGCKDGEQRCSERKLFEGKNPKTGLVDSNHHYWNAAQTQANVNSQWEKLRK